MVDPKSPDPPPRGKAIDNQSHNPATAAARHEAQAPDAHRNDTILTTRPVQTGQTTGLSHSILNDSSHES